MERLRRRYEAFISYSHQADGALAAELQRSLNRIARPTYKWWQWWPPRVFRDQTNLAAAADLSGEIRDALLRSDSFVLLASPAAADSHWVNEEAATWCASKPRDRLLIALTGGSLVWDNDRHEFESGRTDAIPPALDGVFEAEPLWVDLRDVRVDGGRARDPRLLDAAATLAAAIRGADKDALVGEDLRQRRRTRQLVGGAVGLLTALTLAATTAALYAIVQRNRAEERARIATSRQLAAQAVSELGTDPEQSLALAARAATTRDTVQAVDALRQALRASRLRASIDAGVPVRDAEVSPAGGLLAAALESGVVRIWNLRTRRPILSVRLGSGEARSVGFSDDGQRMVAAGAGGVRVWAVDGRAPRLLARFDDSGPPGPAAAALGPRGTLVATADFDGSARLWRAATGDLVGEFRPTGPRWPLTDVSFNRDASMLAATGDVQTTVWDLGSGSRRTFRADGSIVWSVAFSPDGRLLATGDDGGIARIWNLRTGTVVAFSGHEGAVKSVAFSPDGASLLTGSQDETARLWSVVTGKPLAQFAGHAANVDSVASVPDGRLVVTGGADGTIRLWATTADPVVMELAPTTRIPPADRAVEAVAFDPGGSRIVTAGKDRQARVWDVPSGRLMQVLPHSRGVDQWVESARFSADGRLVVSAGADGTAKVWRVRRGARTAANEPLATLRDNGLELYGAAFSPDGHLIATVGRDPAVRLWAWQQRKLVEHLDGFRERVNGVAFSRDGSLVAAASWDKTVRVWRVADGEPVTVLRAPEELSSVAFAPNGRLLAAGDEAGGTWIWDLGTHERIGLGGNTERVTDVDFSGDGRYLVSAAEDGVATVWTVPDGRPVTTLRTHAARLTAAAFAPRGRDFAVSGSDGRTVVVDCAECRTLRSLVCLAADRIVSEPLRTRDEDMFASCD